MCARARLRLAQLVNVRQKLLCVPVPIPYDVIVTLAVCRQRIIRLKNPARAARDILRDISRGALAVCRQRVISLENPARAARNSSCGISRGARA